jgi:hypothetical protein
MIFEDLVTAPGIPRHPRGKVGVWVGRRRNLCLRPQAPNREGKRETDAEVYRPRPREGRWNSLT